MKDSMPTDSELDRMTAAAEWLVRLHDSPGDEALIAAWLQWCEDDPGNLHEFRSAQSVWYAATPAATANLIEPPLNELSLGESPPSELPRVDLPRIESSKTARSTLPASSSSRHRWMRARTVSGLAAALLIAVGIGSFVVMQRADRNVSQSYATAIGGMGSSVLPDGSRVELGADSRITTSYTGRLRTVSVDSGEAFFNVAKDPQRPFLVTAGGMQVTAVGTAFNVRFHPGRVVVAVSEGKVQLDGESAKDADGLPGAGRSAGPTPLIAGQQAVYSSASGSVTVAQIHLADVASWRSGVLKYVHEPLGSVAADLSRYYVKRIVINNAALSDLPFTGTVFSTRIEDALHALEDVFPLQVLEHGDSIELVPRS